MKKILIVSNKMISGGVERALISLLNELDSHEFDITLFLLRKNGIWENKIPSHVKIIYCEEINSPKAYIKKLMRKNIFYAIKKCIYLFKMIKSKSLWVENMNLSKFLPEIRQEYDVAISYHAPGTLPVHFVINNVKAKNKILFIHGDIEMTKCTGKNYKELYDKYNHIICVSKESMSIFLRHNPKLKNKTKMIYNIIDYKNIIYKSKENIPLKIDICTVARLSEQKGIDIAIKACKLLLNYGLNIKWYVLGTGPEKQKLGQLIKRYNLEKNFILLGNINNPYPYIANCNIYVQPSRHEGYCLTLAEARILCKPIVTTNFIGAKEQIKNQSTGTIVEIDSTLIANAIQELMSNDDLRKKYSFNLKLELQNSNRNEQQIEQLKKILVK